MTRAYPPMMGTRLRAIRRAHGMSLQTLATVVQKSVAYLSQVESGKRGLDRHSMILALAAALGTGPEALTSLPVPEPGNGDFGSAIEAVRQALLAVQRRHPGGQLLTLDALQALSTTASDAHRGGQRPDEVGAATAKLTRDLHSAIETGEDTTALLELAVRFHAGTTLGWLRVTGAPVDLRLQAADLVRHAAHSVDTPGALSLAAWGGLSAMIDAGLIGLARAELDAVEVSPLCPESTQLVGTLTLCRALLAAVDSRTAEAEAMFDQAGQLADDIGEGDAFGMRFGPTTVAVWHMYGLLELGDFTKAARIGAGLYSLDALSPLDQADYWVTYGRALARVRDRCADAALALCRAEEISPHRLYRDPFARDLIAELLYRSRGPAVDPDLHDMARRCGLVSE
ncbi:MAG: helix-turn-helix domain-containing protein [Pseudonocardiaceae bacterium]